MGYTRRKYGNRKVIVDGKVFDSKHEAERYKELRVLETLGAISDLKTQVKFKLLPSQRIAGKVVERAVEYIADFTYWEDGKLVVEDAKGVRTKEYIIKRKLMLYLKGIRIREV